MTRGRVGELTLVARPKTSCVLSGHRIALNLRTKSLAVVTENVWLKLKNIQDAVAGTTQMPAYHSYPWSSQYPPFPPAILEISSTISSRMTYFAIL